MLNRLSLPAAAGLALLGLTCGEARTHTPAPVPAAASETPVRFEAAPDVDFVGPLPEGAGADAVVELDRVLAPVDAERAAHWLAPTRADVVALQPRRTVTAAGGLELVDLNPAVGRWFVVRAQGRAALHLEVLPGTPVTLDEAGLAVDGVVCDPWATPTTAATWTPVCGGSAWLRKTGSGRKTALERATDTLRDRIPMGEQITVFVRDSVLKDQFLRTAAVAPASRTPAPKGAAGAPPTPALSNPATIVPSAVGLIPADQRTTPIPAGTWQQVSGHEGAWFGVWTASLIPEELLAAHTGPLLKPDADEKGALAVMVAFDLDAFDLDFVLGTDHPRVGWSERVPASTVIAGVPGPDGFDTVEPLGRTGQVAPWERDTVTAAFTGGFKRSHGAFKLGEPAATHRGSHYGFIEQGVVASRPVPGLATVVVTHDGTVDLRTWTDTAPEAVDDVLHLRQTGLPLVHSPDGVPVPGDRVTKWAEGNWSGSAEGRLRALRAGLCLIEDGDRRFLVYGYFTGATPSTMAWAFLAHGCSYGLLTDMNALEHTYLAFYDPPVDGQRPRPRHLDTGMSVLDVTRSSGEIQARFLDFADNRDFFTVRPKVR